MSETASDLIGHYQHDPTSDELRNTTCPECLIELAEFYAEHPAFAVPAAERVRLRKYRQAYDYACGNNPLTISDIAKSIGVSENQFYRWETRQDAPHKRNMLSLYKYSLFLWNTARIEQRMKETTRGGKSHA